MINRKAELGIATLILLSAITLVSAVIFVAFTTTAEQVNQEARSAGMTIRENIGSAMNVIDVYAEDGSTSNSVDYFYMSIKPPYASDEIKLNDTLLIFGLDNISEEYQYDNTINCSIKTSGNSSSIYNSTNNGHFGVAYPNGDYTYENTIVAGEVVRLCWKSPRSIEKGDKILINFFGIRGYNARIVTSYKDLITEKTIYLFP